MKALYHMLFFNRNILEPSPEKEENGMHEIVNLAVWCVIFNTINFICPTSQNYVKSSFLQIYVIFVST